MLQKLSWQVNQWGMTSAIVCLVLYVAAYVAMLNPEKLVFCSIGSGSRDTPRLWTRLPNYRLHMPLVEKVFQPINQLDRMIRPSYWVGTDSQPGFNHANAGNANVGGFGGGGFGGSEFGGGFGGQPNCNSCRR